MDISALVNHDGDATVLLRRSLSNPHPHPLSNPHPLSAPSPVTSAAKIPTPLKTAHKQMSLKRRRDDPKPIWAYREGEELPPELKAQQAQRQKARQPAPAVQSCVQAQPLSQPHPPLRPQPSPMAERNGHPPSDIDVPVPPHAHLVQELTGFERPISNDASIYNDISRNVCDFIWNTAVNSEIIRNVIKDPKVQLEVEARWGHIIDTQTHQRMRGPWRTETVIDSEHYNVKFESTMTVQQHKRMNLYLNSQVHKSKLPGANRPSIDYRHTYETDTFYELDQQGFNTLHPVVQHLIGQTGGRQRVRVTHNKNTGEFLRAIIKHKIGNLEVSSPKTEWDYRVGINLEIEFAGSIDNLVSVVEAGKTPESMQRQKDRMSYSWLGAYQVDLTQVTQGTSKNHELELELDSGVLIAEADKVRKKEVSRFESLINGMMNNLRVLSREMTPPAPGA